MPSLGIWKMLKRKCQSDLTQKMIEEVGLSRNNWYSKMVRHVLLRGSSGISIHILDNTDKEKHSPKNTPSYTNETLRTELGRETPCVVQVFENQRREMHEILMRII